MMIRILVFIVIALFASCSFSKQFRTQEFGAAGDNKFQVLVPKGWSRTAALPDSSGRTNQFYYYPDGAYLYISNSGRAINPNEIIDTARHIALPHANGGLVYKGVMPGLLYWREIQKDNFRFGYRNVQTESESRFDSALNYSALMKEVR
jgi:hypothetical protein